MESSEAIDDEESEDEMNAQGGFLLPLLSPRTVGEALSLLRARADLNRDDVAERADVATGTLSRYERDQTVKPDVAALRRIVNELSSVTGDDPAALWAELGVLLDARERRSSAVDSQVRAVHRRQHT